MTLVNFRKHLLTNANYDIDTRNNASASVQMWKMTPGKELQLRFPISDCYRPYVDQRHQWLSFLSGHFPQTQLRWSVLKKEAFEVMMTLTRHHRLFATPHEFDLCTNHNLVFLTSCHSSPTSVNRVSVRCFVGQFVQVSKTTFISKYGVELMSGPIRCVDSPCHA